MMGRVRLVSLAISCEEISYPTKATGKYFPISKGLGQWLEKTMCNNLLLVVVIQDPFKYLPMGNCVPSS